VLLQSVLASRRFELSVVPCIPTSIAQRSRLTTLPPAGAPGRWLSLACYGANWSGPVVWSSVDHFVSCCDWQGRCLIRKLYEVHPLFCPQRDRRTKVIDEIEHPAVTRQILSCLRLRAGARPLRAHPGPPGALPAQEPREESDEPLFDDIPMPDPVVA